MQNTANKKMSHADILTALFNRQTQASPVQQEALQKLFDTGIPTLRTERWKYTSLRKALHTELNLECQKVSELSKHPAIEALFASEYAFEIVQLVNGKLHGQFAQTTVSIQISDEIVVPSHAHQDQFINNLNLAFLQNNYQLKISGKVEKLVVLHIHTSTENSLRAQQISIEAAQNSEAKILLLHTSSALANTLVPVVNLLAEENSDIELYHCQDLSAQTLQLGQTNIELQRDAVVSMVQLELGGDLVRHNLVVDALATGAEFNLSHLFVGSQRQHLDTHLDMFHHAAHTQSTMLSKGILDERARGVFNGKIYVKKDAQQINANLNNDNLLLSKYAEINTKPELEIYADDVKCAHGATVGQLDEKAIFYLRSRGLDTAQATSLLTFAFARQAYVGILPEPMTNWLDARLGFENN